MLPQFLKDATCELALTLLGSDTTAQPDTVGFSELKLDVMGLKIDAMDRDKYGALPDAVLSMVEPFGQVRSRSGTGIKKLIRA